jgi:hypothetical protein
MMAAISIPWYEAASATRLSALSRLQIAKDAQDGLAQEPDRTSAVLRLTFIQFVQHPLRANRACNVKKWLTVAH